MQIKVTLWNDGSCKRLAEIIVSFSARARKWHGEQQVQLRTTGTTGSWFMEQINGGFMQHLDGMIQGLSTKDTLEVCGFIYTADEAKAVDNKEVISEDEFADVLGMLSFGFVAKRMRRCLYIFWWPWRFCRVNLGEALARATVKEFRRDLELFKRFVSFEGKTAQMKRLEERSVFNKTSVQQLELACEDFGDDPSPDVKNKMEERVTNLMTSQPIEDLFGVMKTHTDLQQR